MYQGSAQTYDVVVERGVMIRCRDGARLATDVYRPALDGRAVDERFPILLERTPYDRGNTTLRASGRYFARRGYVVAIQDVRGRFDSDGEWYPFAGEGPDGYDTVEWLAAQPWSDGQVGTIGLSYSGSDQHALAVHQPPHLRAMFVSEGMSNYHTGALRQGGALEMRFVIYAFRMAETSKEALASRTIRDAIRKARARMHEWLARSPLKPGASPLRLVPSYERWALDVLTHADYDEYWQQTGYNIEPHYELHADVPVYLLSGWYDTYTRAVTDNFNALRRRLHSPVRLIIGPWIHSTAPMHERFSGDADFGPEAAMDSYNDFRLRWFDRHLKGLQTGVDDEAPVRIFVMGGGNGLKTPDGRLDHGGRWRDEQEWPLNRAVATPYFLHADGSLGTDPPGDDRPSTYRFDPKDPVPTIGGNISAANDILPPGGFDQRGRPGLYGCKDDLPLSARHDVLVFQTEPLARPVEVSGRLSVKLWIASSAPDTDFTAKLIDVYPPNDDYPEGYALNIADSLQRARYRNGRERGELLQPGEVYPLEISLYPTSNLFAAGHRIRLDISSSNFPRFDVNPNTGEPLGTSHRTQAAENTVFHDADRPSQIVLPVVPG